MNISTCLQNGFDIIENVDVEKRYQFNFNQNNERMIEQETDVLGALTLCDAIELEDDYNFSDMTTYNMYYKDKQVLFYAHISELEDYIDRLVMKDVFGTIKVKVKQLKQIQTKEV